MASELGVRRGGTGRAVGSCQLSVVSCQSSVECLAATRRGARSNCGIRNSECGMRIRVVSRQYTDPTPYSASGLRSSNRPGWKKLHRAAKIPHVSTDHLEKEKPCTRLD